MNKEIPLFRTTDGVDMFYGMGYYYIACGKGNKIRIYHTLVMSCQDYKKGMAQFSKLSLAEEYLKTNK